MDGNGSMWSVGRRQRTRAPRGSLSRERIVEAALDIIDGEGLARMTMPTVAARLGVGTMSLYRHVRDKADLVEAVADRIFEDLEVPSGGAGDWRGRVVGYLLGWRRLAIAHPALADILAARPLGTRRLYEHLETCMAVLREAGFGDRDAVRTFFALFSYVFGFVLWELPRAYGAVLDTYATDQRDDIDELPADRFPELSRVRDLLSTNASEEQFVFGLERLVDCLEPEGRPHSRRR